MTQVDLPLVKPERGRDGRVRYWYFRRSGRRWRLTGEPMSAEFMAEYHRLVAATAPTRQQEQAARGGLLPGPLGALVAAYFADREAFEQKKAGYAAHLPNGP